MTGTESGPWVGAKMTEPRSLDAVGGAAAEARFGDRKGGKRDCGR